jgi:hypothetical protein
VNQPAPTNREKIVGFLGERAERRTPPSLADALAAAGGVLVAAGLAVIGFEALYTNDSNVTGILLSLLVIAAAVVAPIWAPEVIKPGCVAALIVSVPVLWFFLIVAESSSADTGGANFLTVVTLAVLFVVPHTRGRIALLAFALYFFAGWIVTEVGGLDAGGVAGTTGLDPSDTFSGGGSPYDDIQTASIVSLVVGGAMLLGGWALDRQRLAGLATPFIVVGAVTALAGAALYGFENELGAVGLLVFLAGAGVAITAVHGPGRRATTWLGAVAAVFGLVLVIFDAADDSAVTFGVVAAILGAGVIALTLVLPPWLRPSEPGGPRPVSPGPSLPGPAPQ